MRHKSLTVFAAIFLISGCRTVRGASGELSSVGYNTANASARIAYIPVGRLIDRHSPFKPEGGGYAIVVLRPGTSGRNRRACRVMQESMRVRVGPADGRPIIMDEMLVDERPVYWPVMKRTRVNCAEMLANYDFERGIANLQLLGKARHLGQGPFVLVRRENGNEAGLFDFSSVAVEDFNDQFAAIVNYMSQRADVWQPDFYETASLREKLRYYLLDQSGGGPIVVAGLFDIDGR